MQGRTIVLMQSGTNIEVVRFDVNGNFNWGTRLTSASFGVNPLIPSDSQVAYALPLLDGSLLVIVVKFQINLTTFQLVNESYFVTACAAGAEPASTDELVTANGFVCPEPNPRVEFESKTINIFTWTEYVPADILDCFGLVYGVTVNTDYFSSNEELYSKISLGEGVNPYDVIHPSDYMIAVLMREGLLQELDPAQLPNCPTA